MKHEWGRRAAMDGEHGRPARRFSARPASDPLTKTTFSRSEPDSIHSPVLHDHAQSCIRRDAGCDGRDARAPHLHATSPMTPTQTFLTRSRELIDTVEQQSAAIAQAADWFSQT